MQPEVISVSGRVAFVFTEIGMTSTCANVPKL